ncbi:GhoT/OrtT family toxin [Kosakonia sp. ML.JS2a]
MAVVSGVITYFLASDTRKIRLLSAVLVGATWPMSLPVALLISLL